MSSVHTFEKRDWSFATECNAYIHVMPYVKIHGIASHKKCTMLFYKSLEKIRPLGSYHWEC